MIRSGTRIALAAGIVLGLLSPGTAAAQPAGPTPPPPWLPQIAVVWPHDEAGRPASVQDATHVNVSVWPRGQVPCDAMPGYRLLVARGAEPSEVLAETRSQGTVRVVGASHFPSLEYNDVAASLGGEPAARYAFVVYGEVQSTRLDLAGNVWVHAADARTIYPEPVVPTGRAATPHPDGYDARIQIVWPHDGRGLPAPVDAATHVNAAVEVFAHGTRLAAIPDASGAYPFGLSLLRAEGNGALARVPIDAQIASYDVGGEEYPRWVFNDVPVTPGTQTHFLVSLLPAGGKAVSPHTTVWTHAADGRTILPEPTPPPACAPAPQPLSESTAHVTFIRTTCTGAAPSSCYGGLYARDPDGDEEHHLTPHSPANYYYPAYSPDGRWLAFASDRDAQRYQMAIHVVRADGSGLGQVSERYSQTYGPVYWSRDGSRLALRYPGDGLYHVYTLEGEGPERVEVLPYDEWIWPNDSPDGRWRAVPCGHSGAEPLIDGWCLLERDADENPFGEPWPGLSPVAWSPDSERVAVGSAGSIWLVARDGSGSVRLGDGHSPTWQPRPAGD